MKKIIPIILMLTLALSSCGQVEKESEKLQVYTSFYAMYDFARTIGGEDIELENIVPTGTEPHDFEPTASDMAKLSAADVFIYNGVGMEGWVDKVKGTLPETVNVLCTSEQLAVNDNDPHVWLSMNNAQQQLQKISELFAEQDTENSQNYSDRFKAYSQQISELETEYKNAGLEGKTIFVTHGAYSYLCDDFGMEQVALEGISGDSDPSPAQMASVVNQIKSEGAKCIFYDPIEGDKMALAVANEADVEALPLCTFEGDEENRDYLTVMKANLEQLKKSL